MEGGGGGGGGSVFALLFGRPEDHDFVGEKCVLGHHIA